MDQNTITLMVGLLAPISTVAGVWIANRFNSKENQKRLEFEARDKENQRKHELTKDIFLKAAEDIVMINGHLAGMVFNSKLRDKNEISSIFFANLNKMSLVASAETSIFAIDLSQSYVLIYTESLGSLTEIIELESEISALNHILDKNQLETDRIQAKLKECLEKESPDFQLFDRFMKNFQQALDLQKEYSDRISENNVKLSQIRLDTVKTIMTKIEMVQPKIMNLMKVIREEIGVESINLDLLEKSLAITANDLKNTFETTLEKFK